MVVELVPESIGGIESVEEISLAKLVAFFCKEIRKIMSSMRLTVRAPPRKDGSWGLRLGCSPGMGIALLSEP